MYSASLQHQTVDHSTATLKLYESASKGLPSLRQTLASILNSETLQIHEKLVEWRNEIAASTQVINIADHANLDHSHRQQLLLNHQNGFLCIPLDGKVELVLSGEESALTKLIHDESIKSLLPHISQALCLSHKICKQKQELQSCNTVLDHYPLPVLAIDNHFNTIFANKMARQQFSNTISETADNLISELQTQAREHIDVLKLCDSQSERLAIRNALINLPYQNNRTLSQVTIKDRTYPIVIAGSDSVPNVFQHYARSTMAWIYILSDSFSHYLENNSFFQNMNLSKSEKELCALLFDGQTLTEIAKRRRVSDQTVRKQLQSTLRKTHLDSQEALIIYLFENCIEQGLVH